MCVCSHTTHTHSTYRRLYRRSSPESPFFFFFHSALSYCTHLFVLLCFVLLYLAVALIFSLKSYESRTITFFSVIIFHYVDEYCRASRYEIFSSEKPEWWPTEISVKNVKNAYIVWLRKRIWMPRIRREHAYKFSCCSYSIPAFGRSGIRRQ